MNVTLYFMKDEVKVVGEVIYVTLYCDVLEVSVVVQDICVTLASYVKEVKIVLGDSKKGRKNFRQIFLRY